MSPRLRCLIALLVITLVPAAQAKDIRKTAPVPKPLSQDIHLDQGQAVTISARIDKPSTLPDNGRLRATWALLRADDPKQFSNPKTAKTTRKADAQGIYTLPTPNWT